MRKLIASINVTIDGFCDHTAGIADEELHEFFNALLRSSDTLLYGRTTYQMMECHWPLIVKKPTGNQPMDDFAVLIDNIPKIVYSTTLKSVEWKNTVLKHEIVREEITALKQLPGKNIMAGSPSLILALTQLGLVDEFQLLVHPVIVGSGLRLFKNLQQRADLQLLNTKRFGSGVVVFYYQPRP